MSERRHVEISNVFLYTGDSDKDKVTVTVITPGGVTDSQAAFVRRQVNLLSQSIRDHIIASETRAMSIRSISY